MSERWRRTVGQIGRIEPDIEKLRATALEGPRLPSLGEDVARPTGSRVIAAIVAITLAVATFAFVRSGFGDTDGFVPAGPAPATVCGTTDREEDVTDFDVVELGGYEVSTWSLNEAGTPFFAVSSIPRDDLRAFYTNGFDRSTFPADGWREVYEEEGTVVLAAPTEAPDQWYHVAFTLHEGRWLAAGWGSGGLGETVAQRGEGLRLEWRSEIVVDRRSPQDGIWLVNERNESWVDEEGGEYHGIVHLFDPASGQEVEQGEGGVFGTGKAYNVPPGDAVELPLAFGNLDRVPDGTYTAIACVPKLGLASPLGTLTLTGGDEPEQSDATADPITAGDLVKALGLTPTEYPVDLENGECTWAVDVEEVPYCLDPVADDESEASLIVEALREGVATTDELVLSCDADRATIVGGTSVWSEEGIARFRIEGEPAGVMAGFSAVDPSTEAGFDFTAGSADGTIELDAGVAWAQCVRPPTTIEEIAAGAVPFIVLGSAEATIDGSPAVTAESLMANGGPVRDELATLLGLTLRDGFVGDCGAYVEVASSGAGYCLDPVPGEWIDRYAIGKALQGHIMSAAEIAAALAAHDEARAG